MRILQEEGLYNRFGICLLSYFSLLNAIRENRRLLSVPITVPMSSMEQRYLLGTLQGFGETQAQSELAYHSCRAFGRKQVNLAHSSTRAKFRRGDFHMQLSCVCVHLYKNAEGQNNGKDQFLVHLYSQHWKFESKN